MPQFVGLNEELQGIGAALKTLGADDASASIAAAIITIRADRNALIECVKYIQETPSSNGTLREVLLAKLGLALGSDFPSKSPFPFTQ